MDQWCKSCLNIKVSCSTTRKKKYEKWTQNANKLFWVPEHWKNCAGLNFPISLIIRMIEKSFIVSFSGYLASRRINEQKMDFVWFLWTWSLFFLITKCKYLHKNCFLRIYILFGRVQHSILFFYLHYFGSQSFFSCAWIERLLTLEKKFFEVSDIRLACHFLRAID